MKFSSNDGGLQNVSNTCDTEYFSNLLTVFLFGIDFIQTREDEVYEESSKFWARFSFQIFFMHKFIDAIVVSYSNGFTERKNSLK